jgi:SAM-dependent methyltransferase
VTRETFDEIASIYDEALPAHVTAHYLDKRVAYVLDHCAPGRGLDVGCGTGVLAERLQIAGFAMTGIDPSPEMLRVLEKRAPLVTAIEGSGDALPFADASFELVLTVAALHHIAEPGAVRRTLGEMVRVCSPGGRIVVWDHNPRNPYWKLLMARVPQDDGSERLIGEQEVLDGITAGGGRVLSSERLGFVPDFLPARAMRFGQALERLVERSPARELCAHNVVLATRS